MKKTLFAAAAIVALATAPAMAFEVGDTGVNFDSTVEATYAYDVVASTGDFTVDYTANLNYSFDDFTVFAESTVEVTNPVWNGFDAGLAYAPAEFEGFEAKVYGSFNADFEFTTVTAVASYTF